MARYSRYRYSRPSYGRSYSGASRALRYYKAKLYKLKKRQNRRNLLNRIRTNPDAQQKYIISKLKKLFKETQNPAVISGLIQSQPQAGTSGNLLTN